MTTEELKNLIASKIAGQGSAVDAGSALPDILNGIVDSVSEIRIPAEFTENSITIKRSDFDRLHAEGSYYRAILVGSGDYLGFETRILGKFDDNLFAAANLADNMSMVAVNVDEDS